MNELAAKIYSSSNGLDNGTDFIEDCASVFSKEEKYIIPAVKKYVPNGGVKWFLGRSSGKYQLIKFEQNSENSLNEQVEDTRLNGSWPYLDKVPDNMSEECFDYCNSQGLSGDIEKCLSKVKDVFCDNIVHLFAELDYFVDDEPVDNGHIVIRLKISSDEQVAEQQEDNWDIWFISNISDYTRSKIVLDVDRG